MRSYEETVKALNQMIPEIHKNAVNHGWWDEPRDIYEIYSLIHSEFSEALEEYRNNMPEIYCTKRGSDWCEECYGNVDHQAPGGMNCLKCYKLREESQKVPNKPEGTIVELADAVIRIMDYFGNRYKDFEVVDGEPEKASADSFAALIAFAHQLTAAAFINAYLSQGSAKPNDFFLNAEIGSLSAVVKLVWKYAEIVCIDLVEIIQVKHNFNKTRTYKHGGKRI